MASLSPWGSPPASALGLAAQYGRAALAWLADWQRVFLFGAMACVLAVSPSTYDRANRESIARHIYVTSWRILPWFTLLAGVVSLVLIRVVLVTALQSAGQFTLFSYFAPYYRQVLHASGPQNSWRYWGCSRRRTMTSHPTPLIWRIAMQQNMGTADRIIRGFGVAPALLVAAYLVGFATVFGVSPALRAAMWSR